MNNEYIEQITRLTLNPEFIREEWANSIGLFKMIEPKTYAKGVTRKDAGDIILIKQGTHYAMPFGEIDEDFTRMVRDDKRLPRRPRDITPEHLIAIMEWVMLFDPMLEKNIDLTLNT